MEEIRYIEIVAQYQDMVYRIALHDCRNSHDAEDIMQTVFMKLYQADRLSMEKANGFLSGGRGKGTRTGWGRGI